MELWHIAVIVASLIFTYVVVRIVGRAWYASKREHIRWIYKETKDGNQEVEK